MTSRGNRKPANAEAEQEVMRPVSPPTPSLNATVPLKSNTNIDLFIGKPNRSTKYVARVSKQNGDVRKRLMRQTVEGPGETVQCRLRARWRPARDTVTVTVPWGCLNLRRGTLAMRAGAIRDQDLRDPDTFDEARRGVVARGSAQLRS